MEKTEKYQSKMQQKKLLKNTVLKISDKIEMDVNLDRVFKNFSKEKQYTIPIFIPHLGCRNDCVFCNQKRISGNTVPASIKDISKTIEEYLEFFKDKNRKVQIAFFGGSFTGISIEEQKEYLEIASKYIRSGAVDSIRLSTRPDYITTQILEMLKNYGVKTIELGVQSMDDNVLKLSKRGHCSEDVVKAIKLIKKFDFQVGVQIMVGLPGSKEKIELSSIKKVLTLKPDQIRIYPVYVIENSELYDMFNSGEYTPITIEEAVKRVYLMMKTINKTDTNVIRIGLQSSDEITQNNEKVFGPVCDNFAEHVMAKLVLYEIENIIKKNIKAKDKKIKEIEIQIDKNIPISMVIGPKKINKTYLEKTYNKKFSFKVKG